jgi:hypothetical protein
MLVASETSELMEEYGQLMYANFVRILPSTQIELLLE